MDLKIKYNVGQALYVVMRRDTNILKTCPTCKGEKEIPVEGYRNIKCPNCSGGVRQDGKVLDYTESEWYVHNAIVVNCIRIQLLDQEAGIRYRADYSGTGSGYPEHRLFPSQWEAEEWCKQANKDPMAKGLWLGKDIFLPKEESDDEEISD